MRVRVCVCVGDREDGTEHRNFQVLCTFAQLVRNNLFYLSLSGYLRTPVFIYLSTG